ncbi:beta-propeller fold lactonase family protein [Paenibacillus agilis]|uniref:YncE family protein n=1 Tax=Paenibacillus agilis TaxID=3020863 RepID=A0A559IVS9_9BACL|nr:YncE family protein [Paenibacillus agilis]TVX91752.1 YncE family protein [Paenibacillus agilis]
MPLYDSGPIDNSQTGRAAFAEVSAVNAGLFPTNVSIQLYELPPLVFGTQTNNLLFTSLFHLQPRGNPNNTLSSGLVALGSAFGVRVISSGPGEDDIAVHVTLYNAGSDIIRTLNVPATAPTPLFAYVSTASARVTIIDTSTNQVVQSLTTDPTIASASTSTPDGTRLYVAVQGSNVVDVFDTTTSTLITSVPTGGLPQSVLMRPDGLQVYSANAMSNNVVVIDVDTNTPIGAPIPTGINPFALAFSLPMSKAYVTDFSGPSITVINTNTLSVLTTIPLVASPFNIAATPDGSKVFACLNTNNVVVIDTATDSIITTINLSPSTGVFDIAITPDGTKAYVTASTTNEIRVINTITNAVINNATIPLGNGPRSIAITPDGKKAYITTFSENVVQVIDLKANTNIATIIVDTTPNDISIAPNLLF